MANKKVRILVDGPLGGVAYRCNDVVNLPDALAKAHADAVDANKEAVAYALSINGGNVIEHVDPQQAQRTALEELIAQLEASLAAADEAGKAAIAADIDATKQQLAALG